MTITKEQLDQLEALAIPLQEWLSANCHPHCMIVMDDTRTQLLEGLASTIRPLNHKES